jgi:DNA-directed RNA polymerase specialized sigma24 family protein
MTAGPTCRCLLCKIERELLYEIKYSLQDYQALLGSSTNGLCAFSSPLHLLSNLKAAHADSSVDELYRELLTARHEKPELVEALLILAFVPVLHGTVRRIAKQQVQLTRADITQQALSVFLEVLRSEPMRQRQSHFVYAISRLLKRQLFEWAGREGTVHGPAQERELLVSTPSPEDDFMERHALLRHFLHSCVTRNLLTGGELDLLIQIKIDGNTGDEIAESNSITSNAVRQRMKRLLAKLRRIAGTD